MYNLIIEFKNGETLQVKVSKIVWDKWLFYALEADDSVIHYTVDTI